MNDNYPYSTHTDSVTERFQLECTPTAPSRQDSVSPGEVSALETWSVDECDIVYVIWATPLAEANATEQQHEDDASYEIRGHSVGIIFDYPAANQIELISHALVDDIDDPETRQEIPYQAIRKIIRIAALDDARICEAWRSTEPGVN